MLYAIESRRFDTDRFNTLRTCIARNSVRYPSPTLSARAAKRASLPVSSAFKRIGKREL